MDYRGATRKRNDHYFYTFTAIVTFTVFHPFGRQNLTLGPYGADDEDVAECDDDRRHEEHRQGNE